MHLVWRQGFDIIEIWSHCAPVTIVDLIMRRIHIDTYGECLGTAVQRLPALQQKY